MRAEGKRPHGQMTPGLEPHLQLLHRAYCYLRLCGVSSQAALEATRSSMGQVMNGDGLGAQERVWREVELLAATHEADPVPPCPPLMRGSMHYAHEARRGHLRTR